MNKEELPSQHFSTSPEHLILSHQQQYDQIDDKSQKRFMLI